MKLEIMNLSSKATFEVPPDGAVLGREKAKSDIAVPDNSVSKRHARIYAKNGDWYLEDLGSSNGTFLNSQRVYEAAVLTQGSVFSLSENQFEVVKLESEAEAAPAGQSSGAGSDPDIYLGKQADQPTNQVAAEGDGPSKASIDDDDGGEPEAKGIGYFFIAVPKAALYYLGAVPLLALNPFGFVRKSIENPRFDAMAKMELIAYALPSTLFSAAVGFICTLIAQLVTGTLSIASILPIVPLVSAVIGAVVSGLIMHPLLSWLVRILKGESTPKSRTNFFITQMTASILIAIPTGVATLIALVPLPFVDMIPIVLALAGSLLSSYVAYRWFKAFEVVKFVPYVFLVLGALGCVSSALALVSSVRTGIARVTSGSSSSGADQALAQAGAMTDEARRELEKVKETAEAAAKAAEAAQNEGGEAAKAAMEAAQKGAEAAQKAAEAGQKGAEAATKAAKERAEAAEKAAKAEAEKAAKAAEKAAEKTAEKANDPENEKGTEEPEGRAGSETAEDAPRTPGSGRTSFEAFAEKRDAVEKAIGADPTLLKNPKILERYKKLHRENFNIKKNWQKKKLDPSEEKVNARLRDLETFESTKKMVEELHQILFR